MYNKFYALISKFKIYKRLEKVRFLKPYLSEQGLWQFIKYFTVGVGTALFELALIWILYEAALKSIISGDDIRKLTANSAGMVIAFICNFILNKLLSFKAGGDTLPQFIKYVSLFAFNLLVTNLILYVFSSILGIHLYIVKITTMGIIVLWNFIIYKKFIFKAISYPKIQ